MVVEGASRRAIRERYGTLREMEEARLGRGTCTDDTRMAADLARGLLDGGGVLDPDAVARRFGEGYDPTRGYGGNTRRILEAICSGTPWRDAALRFELPGGSWANGAAMRVAPVALAFPDDPAAVREAALSQARITGHNHPIGRAGAVLQALAVREALARGAGGDPIEPPRFVVAVRDAHDAWPEEFDGALRWIEENLDARPGDAVRALGTGARASRSVPAALWAFLTRWKDAEAAIVRGVNLGGDADTIGAMAGALAGAYRGAEALPRRWLDALEDGPRGRSDLVELADRLFETAGRAASGRPGGAPEEES